MQKKQTAKGAVLLVIIAAAVWRVVDQGRRSPSPGKATRSLEAGESAPNFTLPSSSKQDVSLTSLAEKGSAFVWFYAPG